MSNGFPRYLIQTPRPSPNRLRAWQPFLVTTRLKLCPGSVANGTEGRGHSKDRKKYYVLAASRRKIMIILLRKLFTIVIKTTRILYIYVYIYINK
jgi:hypothetical protein